MLTAIFMGTDANGAPIGVPVVEVKNAKDAHGGFCEVCEQFFDVSTNPYWHWTKSVWMHRQGTGHAVALYRFQP